MNITYEEENMSIDETFTPHLDNVNHDREANRSNNTFSPMLSKQSQENSHEIRNIIKNNTDDLSKSDDANFAEPIFNSIFSNETGMH